MSATLIVQPHRDDAVLGAYNILANIGDLTVLTVFPGDPDRWTVWDAASGFTSGEQAVTGRAAEDHAAITTARGFRPVLEQTLLTPECLGATVGAWARLNPRGYVFLPAGAGLPGVEAGGRAERTLPRLPGPVARVVARAVRWVAVRRTKRPPHAHPEHVWVRDTALAALAALEGPVVPRVWLYDELPYATASSAVGVLGEDHRVDRAAKARAVGFYTSQVPLLYSPAGRLDTAAGLPTYERYRRVR